MTDLKSSVEHTDADLNDLSDRVDEIYDYQVDPEYVTNKLIDLEDRSRRNNLRIDGISESRNETWEECEEEIQKVFNEKLGVKNVQIERAHRSKRSKSNINSGKPRTIVCKLLNYKQKEEILINTKKLKGSNVFINEDFCYETMQYRKILWEEVKNLRGQGKIAYLNYRSIVVVPNKSNTGLIILCLYFVFVSFSSNLSENFSIIHLNIRSLHKNIDKLKDYCSIRDVD